MNHKKIRVLVVDDSKYMRFLISKIIQEDPGLEVAGEARDGVDALEKVKLLNPDVVTLDVEMPRMDGLETLRNMLKLHPIPVIMVSQHTMTGGEITIRALEAGAIDFVQKPDGRDALTLERVKDELVAKIKMAAGVKIEIAVGGKAPQAEMPTGKRSLAGAEEMKKVVVIGSSTGGPKALVSVLSRLPADAPLGVLVVQHMPPKFTTSLASRLDGVSPMSVSEAGENDRVSQGKVLIAPGGFHLRLTGSGAVRLTDDATVHGVKPAADITMKDAARLYRDKVIGVVLTGMGSDGAEGCGIIKENGGATIAQHASTCVVNGMPASVIKAGHADKVAVLDLIAVEILKLI